MNFAFRICFGFRISSFAIPLRHRRARDLRGGDGRANCHSPGTAHYPLPTNHYPLTTIHFFRLLLLGFSLLASGCLSDPPEFNLNTEGRDAAEVSLAQREALEETLEGLFGTPDVPLAPDGSGLTIELLGQAAGSVRSDEKGRQYGLYRQHCAGCHGISGDGAGPSAGLLNPYPRDFRNGVFKYTSTMAGAKPTRDDLVRTLRHGLPGSAMPSFRNLPGEEIEALVEYIKYLAIRGETELFLFQLIVDEDEYLPLDSMAKEMVADEIAWYGRLWEDAEGQKVAPPLPPRVDTPELWAASLAVGRRLYASKDAECVKCHGPEGRGDGEQTELYDDWNQRKKGVTPELTRQMADRFALPIQQLRPRDYTEGVYRGGDRPIDLYWRIHVGIKGTPMPAAGPAPGSDGVYTPEEIWHLVNYLLSLRKK